jgi:hypothetical protein
MAKSPNAPTREQLLDAAFSSVWRMLARLSVCDGHGGAEYRRVYAEWLALGRPRDMHTFISRRANCPPPPLPPR